MDRSEYKIATEHIKKLISQGEYAEASHIADTIDWKRVKSVMMLCTVSDLYKVNRRYEDAKELLYLAYKRNPQSRTILYSLCDLSIKLEEYVAAIEYYKSFIEVAPKDSGRYVLQYRLYQAQDVSLEERIEVLEQLKKEEYIEKWAYELAYLYHRIGFATKCVEECDELILWFGKGRYVYKAMELKMLHEPLSASQQYIYDTRFEHLEQAKDMTRILPRIDSGMTDETMVDVTDAPTVEIPQDKLEEELAEETEEIQVRTLDVGNAYNTMNLQKELADSLKEILEVSHVESSVDDEAEEDASDYASTAELQAQELMEAQEEAQKTPERSDTVELSPKDIRSLITAEPKQVRADMPTAQNIAADQALQAIGAAEAVGAVMHAAEEEASPADEQIEGQLSIEDILAEWNKQEAEVEEAHKETISNRIKSQTQDIFAAFEAEKKRDLLEDFIGETQEAAENAALEEAAEAAADEAFEADEAFAEEVQDAAFEPSAAEQEAFSERARDLAWEEADSEALPEEEPKQEAEEAFPDADVEEVAEEAYPEADVEEHTLSEAVPAYAEEAAEAAKPEPVSEKAGKQSAAGSEPVANQAGKQPAAGSEPVANQAGKRSAAGSEPVANQAGKKSAGREGKAASRFVDLNKYEQFIRVEETGDQIKHAFKEASMEGFHNNVMLSGSSARICFDFVRQFINDLKKSGLAIDGKTAKISAANLNKKEPSEIFGQMQRGALIIERANLLRKESMIKIQEYLQQKEVSVLLFLVDTEEGITKLLHRCSPEFKERFNLSVDIRDYSVDSLLEKAKTYAYACEYSIDTMGLLAFRTRIEDMLANDEIPTMDDAKSIIDDAIDHANRKTFRHFMDVLLHKRYDEEDMIILKEEDFL